MFSFNFQGKEASLCAGDPPDCLVGGDQGGWAIKGDKVYILIMHQKLMTNRALSSCL